MGQTKIEWTERTWNPVTGCTKVSPGCDNCYAETIANRFAGSKAFPNGFDVTLHPDRLTQPLRWRKPATVFVNSMSDLFHKDVPDDFIVDVFAVMQATPHHTYQVLTKRPGRMRSLLNSPTFIRRVVWGALAITDEAALVETLPGPNIWLGVSVEDQKWANVRIPALLGTPAAVRFLSCEPLLGPVDLTGYLWLTGASTAGPWYDHAGRRRGGGGIGGQAITHIPASDLHWVIVGGESGPKARPMHPDWARSLRDQCQDAGVAFFFKQWGTFDASARRVGKGAAGRELDGRTWDEMPARFADVPA